VAGAGGFCDARGMTPLLLQNSFLLRLRKEDVRSFADGPELVGVVEFGRVSSRARGWFSLVGPVPRVPFVMPSGTWTRSWGSRGVSALRHFFCWM